MQNFILGCAGLALVIGMIVWRAILKERFRARKLTTLAPSLGLSMVKGTTVYRFDTPLFHRGNRGSYRIRNTMEGPVADTPAILFDLYYEVTGGVGEDTSTQGVWHTVAAFAFPDSSFPSFSITKAGFWSRRAPCRVEIEGYPGFSGRFVVTGKEQAAVRALLNPGFIETLLSARPSEKLVIEAASPWLVLYRRGRPVRPEQWKEFLNEASEIAGGFGRYCAHPRITKLVCGD